MKFYGERFRRMNRIFVPLASTSLFLFQAGCTAFEQNPTKAFGETSSKVEVAAVRDIGPLRFLKVIRGRDGGYSARFGDRSVWVFGDTILGSPGEDGSQWRSSTWCWTQDFDAGDGIDGFDEPVDGKGAPAEFLPFTKEELAYNEAYNRQDIPEDRRCRWALWPGPVAVGPEAKKAYVFYSKILAKPGEFNFEGMGVSIAVWDAQDNSVIRPRVNPTVDDATILFPKGDAVLGQGTMVVGDRLYVYGCETKEMSWPCVVARVKFVDALKREAWRFLAGNGRWSKDWRQAVSVMEAAPILTVNWNEHLGKYLAVYSNPFANNISIRTAKQPEGPWSASQVVVSCTPPYQREGVGLLRYGAPGVCAGQWPD